MPTETFAYHCRSVFPSFLVWSVKGMLMALPSCLSRNNWLLPGLDNALAKAGATRSIPVTSSILFFILSMSWGRSGSDAAWTGAVVQDSWDCDLKQKSGVRRQKKTFQRLYLWVFRYISIQIRVMEEYGPRRSTASNILYGVLSTAVSLQPSQALP